MCVSNSSMASKSSSLSNSCVMMSSLTSSSLSSRCVGGGVVGAVACSSYDFFFDSCNVTCARKQSIDVDATMKPTARIEVTTIETQSPNTAAFRATPSGNEKTTPPTAPNSDRATNTNAYEATLCDNDPAVPKRSDGVSMRAMFCRFPKSL